MDEHQPPALTPTEVFERARSIGARELRQVEGKLSALRFAGTVVSFLDKLAGIPSPGSYRAINLRERLNSIEGERQETADALQALGVMQEANDPRGVRVAKVTNELIGATRLAMATGVLAPVEFFTRELDRANHLPSALPTAIYPDVVEGKSVVVEDSHPGPQTLFRYAKYIQQ